jgi:hypothetical protein
VVARAAAGLTSAVLGAEKAAAFCSSAQVGSRSRPARISARVITGYGPLPWPRAMLDELGKLQTGLPRDAPAPDEPIHTDKAA